MTPSDPGDQVVALIGEGCDPLVVRGAHILRESVLRSEFESHLMASDRPDAALTAVRIG